ncbi:hypothetical protein [Funiculus sociatus]|uniref:hypothetical protein n=1 Tax=Funiculus sociatus TaxID=450527 RepID=UPI0032980D05
MIWEISTHITFHRRLKSENLAGVPTPATKGNSLVKAWNAFPTLELTSFAGVEAIC